MSGSKAVLCIDIDGTLIDANEAVHPADRDVLNNFPDAVQPIITTGRILHSARGVLRQNGLFKSGKFPLPGVFMNGGIAFLAFEKPCLKRAFSAAVRQKVIQLAIHFPHTAFTFFTETGVHLVNATPFGQKTARLHYLNADVTAPHALPDEIIKVMVLEPDPKVLSNIEAEAQSLEAEMVYSLTYAYEINPRGITKADGLLHLTAEMGLGQLPVFVLGDAENDLALFDISQASFAPSTAHPQVLRKATHILQREKQGLLTPTLQTIQQLI